MFRRGKRERRVGCIGAGGSTNRSPRWGFQLHTRVVRCPYLFQRLRRGLSFLLMAVRGSAFPKATARLADTGIFYPLTPTLTRSRPLARPCRPSFRCAEQIPFAVPQAAQVSPLSGARGVGAPCLAQLNVEGCGLQVKYPPSKTIWLAGVAFELLQFCCNFPAGSGGFFILILFICENFQRHCQ